MIPRGSFVLERIRTFGNATDSESSAGSGKHLRRTAVLSRSVDIRLILDLVTRKRRVQYDANAVIFRQGDSADCIYFVESGRIKLSRVHGNGREVILAVLSAGDFLGEHCLIGSVSRLATAVSLGKSQLLQIDKQTILGLLRNDQQFAEHFLVYSMARSMRYEDELESQLTNSAEIRLARCLLLLANAELSGGPTNSISHLGHETLAQIVGTTQGRISHFMRSFQRRGLIQYSRKEILVRAGLLQTLLRGDSARADKTTRSRERGGKVRSGAGR